MPNRYVREAAIESEAVNSLKWQAEVFYRRLINRVDDFGRFTANTALLRASIFPLQLSQVRDSDIPRLLAECEKAGLLFVYTVSAKRYLVINKWEKGRAKNSEYPPPPPDISERMQTFVYVCKHMPANVPDSDSDSDANSDTDPDINPSAPPPAPAPELALESEQPAELNTPSVVSPETIYDAYPRKVAKQDALKAIARAMKLTAPLRLLERTQAFAKATEAWTAHDRQFIPHPATWFNRGSYDDDPATWSRATFSGKQLPPMR